MKRLSQVQYTANKKVVTEEIWIQNMPSNFNSDAILMQVFLDKETKQPVVNTNNDGAKQYQANIYGTETYCYIPINAMKALKASGLAKSIDGQVWVKLPLKSVVPSMSDFNNAPAYT